MVVEIPLDYLFAGIIEIKAALDVTAQEKGEVGGTKGFTSAENLTFLKMCTEWQIELYCSDF
jgi:hypothetical protein